MMIKFLTTGGILFKKEERFEFILPLFSAKVQKNSAWNYVLGHKRNKKRGKTKKIYRINLEKINNQLYLQRIKEDSIPMKGKL